MPDVCDLILDDHEAFRRRFAELDERRGGRAGTEVLRELWDPLAAHLELHAAAEEAVFYPMLLDEGVRAGEETDDAINDHNEIRDAVRRAGGEAPGTEPWWQAVDDAREANSAHMAEEERGAIADARSNAPGDRRDALGARWRAFTDEHAGMRGLEAHDRDPDAYIREHRAG